MDVQRKKGVIEVCVLAVLKKGPSYGYMIIRELEQCLEISESTLYPILKRLEQNGSLKTYRREYNGRIRKYYELTEEGQYKIDAFLDEWDEIRMLYQFVERLNALEPQKADKNRDDFERADESITEEESEISNMDKQEIQSVNCDTDKMENMSEDSAEDIQEEMES